MPSETIACQAGQSNWSWYCPLNHIVNKDAVGGRIGAAKAFCEAIN